MNLGWSCGRRSDGYSLLELLIVLAISTIILSALVLSLRYTQFLAYDLNLQTERNGNLWIAPVLLVQWIAAAGNNRWPQNWDGVAILTGTSLFKSDIDGAGGFPDQELTSSYEDIALKQQEETLFLRSGSGSFQPVLRGILSLEVERQEEDLLIIRWSGVTDRPLWTTGEPDVRSAEMKVHLWNYRQNLFAEANR